MEESGPSQSLFRGESIPVDEESFLDREVRFYLRSQLNDFRVMHGYWIILTSSSHIDTIVAKYIAKHNASIRELLVVFSPRVLLSCSMTPHHEQPWDVLS